MYAALAAPSRAQDAFVTISVLCPGRYITVGP
eukprot:COSAG02_NODE_65501_length_258_cov_0.566038_2_plen_31_part_01